MRPPEPRLPNRTEVGEPEERKRFPEFDDWRYSSVQDAPAVILGQAGKSRLGGEVQPYAAALYGTVASNSPSLLVAASLRTRHGFACLETTTTPDKARKEPQVEISAADMAHSAEIFGLAAVSATKYTVEKGHGFDPNYLAIVDRRGRKAAINRAQAHFDYLRGPRSWPDVTLNTGLQEACRNPKFGPEITRVTGMMLDQLDNGKRREVLLSGRIRQAIEDRLIGQGIPEPEAQSLVEYTLVAAFQLLDRLNSAGDLLVKLDTLSANDNERKPYLNLPRQCLLVTTGEFPIQEQTQPTAFRQWVEEKLKRDPQFLSTLTKQAEGLSDHDAQLPLVERLVKIFPQDTTVQRLAGEAVAARSRTERQLAQQAYTALLGYWRAQTQKVRDYEASRGHIDRLRQGRLTIPEYTLVDASRATHKDFQTLRQRIGELDDALKASSYSGYRELRESYSQEVQAVLDPSPPLIGGWKKS